MPVVSNFKTHPLSFNQTDIEQNSSQGWTCRKCDIRNKEKRKKEFSNFGIIESSSCLHCEFLFLFVTVYRPWTNFFLRSIAIFSTAIEILMFNSLMIILWYDSSMIKYKIVKIKKKIYKNIILFVSCMCKKDSIR